MHEEGSVVEGGECLEIETDGFFAQVYDQSENNRSSAVSPAAVGGKHLFSMFICCQRLQEEAKERSKEGNKPADNRAGLYF